ncbi:MAG: hypothetical protein KGH75_04865 [Rhodospirillales bacterium]|nr:hypothetical protein [Rhodospirillales bacterium]
MQNQDEKSPSDAIRKQPTLNVKCHSCIFFKDRAYPSFKKPCHELGIKKFSRTCEHFFANPFIFLKEDPQFKLATKLFKKYENSLPSIVAWLNQELATKKTGFTFGQEIYVRMIGQDYLLNYAKATVVSANKEHVYIQGETFRGTILHESVFTSDQWKRKKKNLIKRKKIKDPLAKTYYKKVTKAKINMDYEVPTIDEFVKLANSNKKETKVLRVNS